MATSNKGRFSERLKKIRLFRGKKNIKMDDIKSDNNRKEESVSNYDRAYDVLKVAAIIPAYVCQTLNNTQDDIKKEKFIEEIKNDTIFLLDDNENFNFDDYKDINKNVSIVSKNNDLNYKEKNVNVFDVSSKIRKIDYENKKINSKIEQNNDKRIEIQKLEKKIIDTIKKNLIVTVNELEIDESELYILSQIYNDEVLLEKCQNNLYKVKDIICKLDNIKKKYIFLKDNYDFEYMLEYNDSSLIDDIINLKRMVNESELSELSNEYKLLKIFETEYLLIKNIQNDAIELENNINIKKDDLEERNINFKELQSKVYNVEDVNKNYSLFVNQQMDIIDEINKNLNRIDTKEIVDYKIIGFDKLISNSLKYMGLLMMSPLRGIFPGIVTQTTITKNVVCNLYKNLHYEEKRKLEYLTIDFSSELSSVIDNLDAASCNIDLTLEEIVKLKLEYSERYEKYERDFINYEETINKINDMENKLLGNKLKVEIMKKKVKEKEKENAKKLIRVKEMNSIENKN